MTTGQAPKQRLGSATSIRFDRTEIMPVLEAEARELGVSVAAVVRRIVRDWAIARRGPRVITDEDQED